MDEEEEGEEEAKGEGVLGKGERVVREEGP